MPPTTDRLHTTDEGLRWLENQLRWESVISHLRTPGEPVEPTSIASAPAEEPMVLDPAA